MPVRAKRILNALTLQDKDAIIKEMEEDEQMQSQMGQQKAQLEMQQLQVDNETKLSYARSQDGLAKERIAKIQTDKAVNAERIQKSKEEKSAGVLNLLKAIKELQSLDLDQIEQSVRIIQAANQPTAEEQQAQQAVNK